MSRSGSLSRFHPPPSLWTTSMMSWLLWPSLGRSHTPLMMYVVRTISVLDKFDKQSVIQSLRNMDQTRSNLSGTSAAFSASSAPPRSRSKAPYKPQSTPSTSSTSNSSSSAPGRPICEFCTTVGHVEAKCFLKQRLLRRLNPPSSPTASPASTSSQSPSDTPQSASAASASPFFFLIPA